MLKNGGAEPYIIWGTISRKELNDKKRWAELMEGKGEINDCISKALKESWVVGEKDIKWA